ncbi:MAG TPA: tetratricopeptide repeat protein [Methylomirabilota bacterium]|nr:tetratricopeptide repeat protein [Methylomirabilota bacterium]
MPSENRIDPRKNFAPRILPWLLAAAMLVVYALTLNHWVSFASLPAVTKISGGWLPEVSSPLLYLATYPFRWLPPAQIPIALNFFSAVCAALALGLLARSVAILPQDRTDAQRKREHSDFAFLTIRRAWLPPLLAVVVCGLQLTFWEHATNYTGEMFDLLLFAFLIWSLLEYRLDEREGRLFFASFIYGASLAENWAMVGFFPVFLGAIVWIRGWSFFDGPFLRRMVLLGLAGILFYFLLPLIAVISSNVPMTFWQALKFNLLPQWNLLESFPVFILHPKQSAEFLSLILAYLLPLLVLSIRWKPSFGDSSKLGSTLTSFMLHLVHAVFLGVLIWIAFDSPFSPRPPIQSTLWIAIQQHCGGAPLLTFYYLGALSIGYYCGYFLLIFGTKEVTTRRRKSKSSFGNSLIIGGVWLLAIVAVAGLIYRNAPQIKSANGDLLWRYSESIADKLPQTGGYLLSDDPQRLALVQSALAREGRSKNFVPLETQSLIVPGYHRFLRKQFPKMWPEIVSATQTNILNPVGLVQVLALLSKTNDIYYLHPSYGYYFEAFYQEPHGLVYKLKPLPEDTLLPLKADKNLIAENETFWSQEAATAFAPIEKAVAPIDPNAPKTFGEKLLGWFQIEREQNQNAFIVGAYYSRSLDFWGVELQRAGELKDAAARFEMATNLNCGNIVAGVNLDFNKILCAGQTAPVDLSKTITDQFNNWNGILNWDGPFDEPSFCFRNGVVLAQDNGFFRQSLAQFNRVLELEPDFLPARLWLGQIYLMARLPDRALATLQEPLANPKKFSLEETNETQLHVLAAAAYFQKNDSARGAKLLETEIARHPDDNDLLSASVQGFIVHGLFTNALTVVDRKLKSAPNDPSWLYARGYVRIQLKQYDEAVADLGRVLAVQTNNDNALFNRAVANLQTGNLDAARADYEKLQQAFTNSFAVAYGLGEIAWRKHETNNAIRNYQIYLANANTNTDEAKTVAERLRELKK